jgi:hypothetical protein
MRLAANRRVVLGWSLALLGLPFRHRTVIAQERARLGTLMTPSFGLGPNQRATFTLFLASGQPLRARVTLHDEGGGIVAESSETEVRGGTFHSFQFDPGDIHMAGEAGTGRRQLQATCWVRVSQPWGPLGDVKAVLEIVSVPTGVTDGMSTTILLSEAVLPHSQAGATLRAAEAPTDMLVGVAPGQALRVSAFNPAAGESTRQPRAPFRMQVNLYGPDGAVAATSREVEIPEGQFGWVTFERGDIPLAGDAITGRVQVRGKPLFAFLVEDLDNRRVATSLEIVDAAGSTVEGIPAA